MVKAAWEAGSLSTSALDDIVHQVLGGREVSREEYDWLLDKIGFHLENAVHEHKMWQAASKTSDELERLDQITALSRKLHRKLASLDEITRDQLVGHLKDQEKPRRVQGPAPAPVPAASTAREMVAQSWNEDVPPLEALARAAQGSRGFLARRAGSLSGTGVRRGAGNLHSHTHGNLRDQVTSQLALLLGRYQGLDAVRTTQGGKLHRLAVAAWEQVVGTDSGTAEGEMDGVVKRVAVARQSG